jgi:hypothetical protein
MSDEHTPEDEIEDAPASTGFLDEQDPLRPSEDADDAEDGGETEGDDG